jgi:general secretion pathway protein L
LGVVGAAPIPVPLGSDGGRRWRLARTSAVAFAGGLAALLLIAAGLGTVGTYTADGTLAELDQAIADRRAVLKAAADSASRTAGPPKTLDDLKQRSRVAVVSIEALSRTLPDDAFLTELRLEGDMLRLVGLSRSVAELVPLIEDSDYFAKAGFFAPTVRMPNGEGDRFSIEAAVEPRTEIAP